MLMHMRKFSVLRNIQGANLLSSNISCRFITDTSTAQNEDQDDYFKDSQSPLLKVESKMDPEFEYEGRLSDRATEDEYTEENLIQVSIS